MVACFIGAYLHASGIGGPTVIGGGRSIGGAHRTRAIAEVSDLHIGRVLLEESLLADQQQILDEIIRVAREEKTEVLMISGDIYDKSIPSAEAVRLFNDFLVKLSRLECEVLMIRGNHDSADRLNFGSRLFDRLNIHIVCEYDGHISRFSKGNVDFYMLPFIKPHDEGRSGKGDG